MVVGLQAAQKRERADLKPRIVLVIALGVLKRGKAKEGPVPAKREMGKGKYCKSHQIKGVHVVESAAQRHAPK